MENKAYGMETTEGCHMSNLSKLSGRMCTKHITDETMDERLNHVRSHVTVKEDEARGE